MGNCLGYLYVIARYVSDRSAKSMGPIVGWIQRVRANSFWKYRNNQRTCSCFLLQTLDFCFLTAGPPKNSLAYASIAEF